MKRQIRFNNKGNQNLAVEADRGSEYVDIFVVPEERSYNVA